MENNLVSFVLIIMILMIFVHKRSTIESMLIDRVLAEKYPEDVYDEKRTKAVIFGLN